MSEPTPSVSQRRHPYLPGLWLAAGFLGLASLAFLLRPLGVTSNTVTEAAAKVRLEKLAKLRQEQEKLADSYGWIDKSKGVGHIPISKAMDLIVPQLRSAPLARLTRSPRFNCPPSVLPDIHSILNFPQSTPMP